MSDFAPAVGELPLFGLSIGDLAAVCVVHLLQVIQAEPARRHDYALRALAEASSQPEGHLDLFSGQKRSINSLSHFKPQVKRHRDC